MFINTNKELDFISEYLFRTCSVATNLVTSLDYNPIHSATTICQFGSTRNGLIANRFILNSSTARCDYVAVPEHFGQSGEPDSKKRGTN